jgi:copper chaperone CopZ
VRSALSSVPGVRHVSVDFGRRQATVNASASQFNLAALQDALRQRGYDGSVIADATH